MKDFPDFMKNKMNMVPKSKQNTDDIEGYYFTATNGDQAAFWTCYSDRVSNEHSNDFDEYTICVDGQYTAIIEGKEIILNPGDELFVPAGTKQGAKIKAGTRTIHFFGGKRV